MTVVLVHGNPETEAIWGPLVDALGRDDVVRLSPPGSALRYPKASRQPTSRTGTGSKVSWRVSTNRSTSSGTTGAAAMW